MIFVYEKDKESWGSTLMRGFSIAKALDVRCVPFENLNNKIKNEVIICLKFSNYKKLLELSRSNKIIIDMVDCNDNIFKNIDVFKNFNSGIFTSYQQLLKFNDYFKKPNDNLVIYHHWDPRLSILEYLEFNQPKIGYFGVDDKCLLYNKIKNIDYYNVTESLKLRNDRGGITFDESLSLYKNYNIHYVIKPHNHEVLLQPMTKISNASAIGCPVISFRNKQYEELLTPDYPYFCNRLDENCIIKTIEKVYDTFKKSEWDFSIKIMKDIKNKTSFSEILKIYKNIKVLVK